MSLSTVQRLLRKLASQQLRIQELEGVLQCVLLSLDYRPGLRGRVDLITADERRAIRIVLGIGDGH